MNNWKREKNRARVCSTARDACLYFFMIFLFVGKYTTVAQTTDKLRIMPLGDSIMNDSRSRAPLYINLIDDGYDVDYVGSQYQEGHIPDPDHEGVGGATIEDLAEKINWLLDEYQPEYIVLMIGTNDIAWYFDETAEEIAERHDALIQQIFDNSPDDVGLVVSTIPPVTPKTTGSERMKERDRAVLVEQFNQAIKANLQQRIEDGYNVVIADVFSAMDDTTQYLYKDGVHPSEAGYKVIANTWYDATSQMLKKDGVPTSSSENEKSQSYKIELHQNYPNPFNPYTNIVYSINKSSDVHLAIYDVKGRKVTTLVNEPKAPGSYSVQWNAEQMTSGMYFYRLQAENQSLSKRMTLIK